MKGKLARFTMLTVLGGALFAGGCSFDSLLQNVWRGFGYSIGGFPATTVVNLIDNWLNLPGVE